MFSFRSTLSTLASLVSSGPRAVLARLLSSALAEHFEVDQDEVESSLLRDARIVLKNTRLRPRRFRSGGGAGGAVLTGGGVVERVEFSWRWALGGGGGGGDEGATKDGSSLSSSGTGSGSSPGGLVRDAVLKIEGLKFRASVERWEDADEGSMLECVCFDRGVDADSASVNGGEGTETTESYLQKYLGQIVDHLTLRISNFEFLVEPIGSGPGIVVGGSNLELLTISSEHTVKDAAASARLASEHDMRVPLRQTITFGSFFADVLKRDSSAEGGTAEMRHPIIEPFSYAADVRRVSGKRFVGGIGSGLEVTGRRPADGGVVLYAEAEQISALSSIGALFAPPPEENAENKHPRTGRGDLGDDDDKPAKSHGDTSGAGGDVKGVDSSMRCPSSQAPPAAHASIMVLPLPTLTLVLPENATLTVPAGITVSYRTDGRVFTVAGTSGVLLCGLPLVTVGNAASSVADDNNVGGVKWVVDLVRRSAILESSAPDMGSEQYLARVLIQRKATERLLKAVAALVANKSRSELSEAMASMSMTDTDREKAPDAGPFIISCRGAVGFRLEGYTPDQNFNATIRAFCAYLSTDPTTGRCVISDLQTEGFELGPYSQGTASVKLPSAALSRDSNTLNFEGMVIAEADSTDNLLRLGRFLSSFAEDADLARTAKENTSKQNYRLPFAIRVSELVARVHDSGAAMTANAIDIRSDLGFMCEHVSINDSNGSFLVLRGLKAASDMRAMVDSIEECRIPGLTRLIAPTSSVQATYSQGWLRIQLPMLRVAMESFGTKNDLQADSYNSDVSIPLHINITVKELSVENALQGDGVLRLTGIDACAKEIENKIAIWNQNTLDMHIERPSNEWMKASVQPSSLWISKSGVELLARLAEFKCAGATLGPSSFGNAKIRFPQIVCRPNANGVHVNGLVDVDLDSIDVLLRAQEFINTLVPKDNPSPSSPTTGEVLPADSLPFPVNIPVAKLSVHDQRLRCTLNAVSIDRSLRIDVGKGSLNIDSSNATISFSGVRASILPEMAITFGSVDTATYTDIFELAEAISEVTVSFCDGTARLKMDSLAFSFSMSALQEAQPAQPLQSSAQNSIPFTIPIPMEVIIGEIVTVLPVSGEQIMYLRLSSVNVVGRQTEEQLISFSSNEPLRMRVESSSGDWIESSICPFNGLVCPVQMCLLEFVCIEGAVIGPSSIGITSMRVPSLLMERDSGLIAISSTISGEIHSTAAEKVQTFCGALSSLVVASVPSKASERGANCYQASIHEIKFYLVDLNATTTATTVVLTTHGVSCTSLRCTQEHGVSVSALSLSASLEHKTIKIGSIFTAEFSNVVRAAKPINNVKLVFRDGALEIYSGAVELNLPKTAVQSPASGTPSGSLELPFPIVIRIESIVLRGDGGGSSSVLFQNLHIGAKSIGKILSLKTHDTSLIYIYSTQSEFLQASVSPFAIGVKDCMNQNEITSLCASAITIGSSSSGFQITVPQINLEEGQGGPFAISSLKMELRDLPLLQKLNSMLLQVMSDILPPSESSTEVPFPFVVQKAEGLILEPRTNVILCDVKVSGNTASISDLRLSEKSGSSVSMTNLSLSDILDPDHKQLDIGSIDEANIPGVGMLSKPLVRASASYDGKKMTVYLPCLGVTTFEPSKPKMPSRRMTHQEWDAFLKNIRDDLPRDDVSRKQGNDAGYTLSTPEGFVLPFPLNVRSDNVTIRSSKGSDTDAVELNAAVLQLRPGRPASSIEIELVVRDAQHKLFLMNHFRASAKMIPSRPDDVYCLQVGIQEVSITAGFSSVEWTNVLGGSSDDAKPRSVYKTPYANIGATKLRVSYQGKVVSASETAMDLDAFVGNATSTTMDIVGHYTSSVTSRLPGILANTEILGTNIVESTATNIGKLAMSSTMTGAGAGSVIGVAAVDSIKGAVRSGKVSRGAGADSSYAFGDFTRGAMRGVGQAVKGGAESRRGDSSHYAPGDFAVGASTAAGEYLSENKSRLGAAGVGGAGAIVGMSVLAGPLAPVGFIAGSYLGAKAGSKVLGGSDDGKGASKTAPMGFEQNSKPEQAKHQADMATPEQACGGSHPGVQQQQKEPLEGGSHSHVEDMLGLTEPAGNTSAVSTQTHYKDYHREQVQPPEQQQAYHMHEAVSSRTSREHQPRGPSTGGRPGNGTNSPPGHSVQQPHYQYHQQHKQQQQQQYLHQQQQDEGKPGYRFGDLTRGVVAKGKKKDGRDEKSGYKFGDFTRGLLG